MTHYKELHKLLEHQEAIAVAKLEQLDMEATTARKRVLERLSKEATRLDTLIEELERLDQRPDWEVLTVRPQATARLAGKALAGHRVGLQGPPGSPVVRGEGLEVTKPLFLSHPGHQNHPEQVRGPSAPSTSPSGTGVTRLHRGRTRVPTTLAK